MKLLLIAGLGFILFTLIRNSFSSPATTNNDTNTPAISPADAATAVREGKAILIDVREPEEWESGVAAPAYLLPLSDLKASRKKWAHVLEEAKDKKVILYCRSGGRSGQAATLLAKEGFTVANSGGFNDWLSANLPVRAPADPADNE